MPSCCWISGNFWECCYIPALRDTKSHMKPEYTCTYHSRQSMFAYFVGRQLNALATAQHRPYVLLPAQIHLHGRCDASVVRCEKGRTFCATVCREENTSCRKCTGMPFLFESITTTCWSKFKPTWKYLGLLNGTVHMLSFRDASIYRM